MTSIYKLFGARLHNLRREQGLSALEMATLCGCEISHYYAIERGDRAPSFQLVVAIAKSLHLDEADLFAWPGSGERHDLREQVRRLPNGLLRETQVAAERLRAGGGGGTVAPGPMQSTFICYGGPDEPFAKRLHQGLRRRGVPTFFFPEDAPPGERLHRVMRNGINQYDRVIVICSRASLDRPGVLNEIEEAVAREARDGGASYLIPISLDDYVFTEWRPPRAELAQALRDRVVADFRGSDTDELKLAAALARLVKVLSATR